MPSRRPPPPRWIAWLYPQLAPLDENPLYQRLRPEAKLKQTWRQRLGGQRGQEFAKLSRAAPGWWTGPVAGLLLVLLPWLTLLALAVPELYRLFTSGPRVGGPPKRIFIVFIVASQLLYFCVIILIGMSVSMGRKVTAIKRFLVNASNEPWGEDLYLSPLADADYDRGVAAALLHGYARGFWRLFLGASFLEVVIRNLWLGVVFPDTTPIGVEHDAKFILLAASISSLLFAFSALYLAFGLRGELARALRGPSAELLWAMGRILGVIGVHLPGAFMASGLAYGYYGGLSQPPDSIPLGQVAALVAAFVGPTLVISNLATRIILRPDLGALGRAMRDRIRARYDGKS